MELTQEDIDNVLTAGAAWAAAKNTADAARTALLAGQSAADAALAELNSALTAQASLQQVTAKFAAYRTLAFNLTDLVAADTTATAAVDPLKAAYDNLLQVFVINDYYYAHQ